MFLYDIVSLLIVQELLTNNFTPFLPLNSTHFYWRWVYGKSKLSGQLSPTRGVWGREGGPSPHFGGSIYPTITIQEKWTKASLWVGDCKNIIAYQILRWGPKVSCAPIPRFGGSIYPIITIQEKWTKASLWVGDCKNTIAYQIWRWGPQVSCFYSFGVKTPVLGNQFTPHFPCRKNGPKQAYGLEIP